MSSAFQSLGNTLTGWGMPNFGASVSNIPYDVGNVFGGAGGGFGATGAGAPPVVTADNPGIGVSMPAGSDVNMPGGPAGSPTSYANPIATGLPGDVALDPASSPYGGGSLSAPPVYTPSPTTTGGYSGMGAPGVDPVTGAAISGNVNPITGAAIPPTAAAGVDPNSIMGKVQAYLSDPKNWGSIIGGSGSMLQGLERFLTARTLANPNALMGGASKLFQGMSKAAKRAIIGPVTAAAQETGQINAPGLYAQSVATALGPYQYQMQMQALEDYIRSLGEAGYLMGGEGPVYQGGSANA